LLWGGGKDALTECPPHTMSGSLPSDEVGKSYTHPVGRTGIKSNDRMELNGIIPIKLQVSHLKEASGVMGKLFSSI